MRAGRRPPANRTGRSKQGEHRLEEGSKGPEHPSPGGAGKFAVNPESKSAAHSESKASADPKSKVGADSLKESESGSHYQARPQPPPGRRILLPFPSGISPRPEWSYPGPSPRCFGWPGRDREAAWCPERQVPHPSPQPCYRRRAPPQRGARNETRQRSCELGLSFCAGMAEP